MRRFGGTASFLPVSVQRIMTSVLPLCNDSCRLTSSNSLPD